MMKVVILGFFIDGLMMIDNNIYPSPKANYTVLNSLLEYSATDTEPLTFHLSSRMNWMWLPARMRRCYLPAYLHP